VTSRLPGPGARPGPGALQGANPPWLEVPAHRAWLLGQANSLLDFFRATIDDTGHFVELDDDGRPMHAGRAAQSVPAQSVPAQSVPAQSVPAQSVPAQSVPAQSVLTVARAVHSYALGELLGVPGCGPIVDRGLEVLWGEHRDTGSGGYLDTVGGAGPAGAVKTAYGHASVLLGASSALIAGHDARALFDDVRAVIDEHFWSDGDGACRESFAGNWDESEPYRGANSNMHMCEAFLAAADAVSGDAVSADAVSADAAEGSALVGRAERIARLLIEGRARSNGWMLPEHYDLAWQPRRGYNIDRLDDPFRPYGVTVGHMLEWSRLVLSVMVAKGDHDTGDHDGWMREAAGALFERAVGVGWDIEHGGLSYTVGFDGSPANPDHYWWPVAEGIGASVFLLHVTGDASYEAWYRKFWDFAASHLIDHVRGGWYPELGPDNRRKLGPWYGKPDIYHALQACLLPLLPTAPSLAGALRSAPPEL